MRHQIAIIFIFSLLSPLRLQIQLIRIQRRVPELGWTTQKIFHLMNFLVNGGTILCLLLFSSPLNPSFLNCSFILNSSTDLLPTNQTLAVRALVFGFHVHVFLLRTKVRNRPFPFFLPLQQLNLLPFSFAFT